MGHVLCRHNVDIMSTYFKDFRRGPHSDAFPRRWLREEQEAVPPGPGPGPHQGARLPDLRGGQEVLLPLQGAGLRGVRRRPHGRAAEGAGEGLPRPRGHPEQARRLHGEGQDQPRALQVSLSLALSRARSKCLGSVATIPA